VLFAAFEIVTEPNRVQNNFLERRHSQRFPGHQSLLISFTNGSQEVAAFLENISLGGAFVCCERFIAVRTQVSLIVVLPTETTHGESVRVWCDSKVVRVEPQLKEGKFGIALEFLNLHVLPQA
jgi:c-di-GMP-binding flagellar brake protein YcgR